MNNRITPTSTPITHGVSPTRDATKRQKSEDSGKQKYAPPHRAQFNYIPTPDVLKNMIDRALEALKEGVYWDRGSIINLLL